LKETLETSKKLVLLRKMIASRKRKKLFEENNY